ncbi:hypothetical protein BON22_4542 [Cyberlindnera fabianii]|uniref:Uncharacterized protein n=2 Tax=Cyberlindnera fabianii TaxID=36022 RepID=A0A1V2L109_CYBFA|nr:hypothetical protein BON22_4542 [Cyberlindnera fabianii]
MEEVSYTFPQTLDEYEHVSDDHLKWILQKGTNSLINELFSYAPMVARLEPLVLKITSDCRHSKGFSNIPDSGITLSNEGFLNDTFAKRFRIIIEVHDVAVDARLLSQRGLVPEECPEVSVFIKVLDGVNELEEELLLTKLFQMTRTSVTFETLEEIDIGSRPIHLERFFFPQLKKFNPSKTEFYGEGKLRAPVLETFLVPLVRGKADEDTIRFIGPRADGKPVSFEFFKSVDWDGIVSKLEDIKINTMFEQGLVFQNRDYNTVKNLTLRLTKPAVFKDVTFENLEKLDIECPGNVEIDGFFAPRLKELRVDCGTIKKLLRFRAHNLEKITMEYGSPDHRIPDISKFDHYAFTKVIEVRLRNADSFCSYFPKVKKLELEGRTCEVDPTLELPMLESLTFLDQKNVRSCHLISQCDNLKKLAIHCSSIAVDIPTVLKEHPLLEELVIDNSEFSGISNIESNTLKKLSIKTVIEDERFTFDNVKTPHLNELSLVRVKPWEYDYQLQMIQDPVKKLESFKFNVAAPALTHLEFGWFDVELLDVSCYPKLEVLSVFGDVDHLDMSGCTRLEKLSIKQNKTLKKVTAPKLICLKELSCVETDMDQIELDTPLLVRMGKGAATVFE